MRTFSKAYGMAGARIGYALTADANDRPTFQKIRLHYGVNRNAQIGALASLSRRRVSRSRRRRNGARARRLLRASRRELGLRLHRIVHELRLHRLGTRERATQVVDDLLRRGVWIRKPGAPPLDRYVRVSAGTEPMRRAFAEAFA